MKRREEDMTTKTDPSALMPITYFPHYAVFMGGSSGGLSGSVFWGGGDGTVSDVHALGRSR